MTIGKKITKRTCMLRTQHLKDLMCNFANIKNIQHTNKNKNKQQCIGDEAPINKYQVI